MATKASNAARKKKLLARIEKFIDPYRVTSGKSFRLKQFDPGDTQGIQSERKPEAKDLLEMDVQWLAPEGGRG